MTPTDDKAPFFDGSDFEDVGGFFGVVADNVAAVANKKIAPLIEQNKRLTTQFQVAMVEAAQLDGELKRLQEIRENGQSVLVPCEELKRLQDENADLRQLAKQHIEGIFSMSLAFDEIDFAKEIALKYNLGWADNNLPEASPYVSTRKELAILQTRCKVYEDVLLSLKQFCTWLSEDSQKYPGTDAGNAARSKKVDIEKALATGRGEDISEKSNKS